MKQVIMQTLSTEKIAKDVYKTVFTGDTSGILRAGQFVNVLIDGLFLRRPISVCDYDEKSLIIIYKVVGQGTEILARSRAGDKFDMLTGLGNGYDLSASGKNPLLIGGGVGVPPLYNLAKTLVSENKNVSVVLGFNTKEDAFYEREFSDLGCIVTLSTVDGSAGKKGFVTDVLPEKYSYYYACGPEPMLKAVYKAATGDGEFSLEERMGCGFGACMGCSVQTASGSKRVCKDGPVFKKGELLW